MVISNSDVLHKIIYKYGLRYFLAVKLSKPSLFIIYFKKMHQILISHLLMFLDGGRKSFESPCTFGFIMRRDRVE